MGLLESWVDKVDGEDDILAENINSVARAVIYATERIEDLLNKELPFEGKKMSCIGDSITAMRRWQPFAVELLILFVYDAVWPQKQSEVN